MMVSDGAVTLMGSYNWTRGAAANSEDLNLLSPSAVTAGPRVRETYSRAEICDPNGYHIELRQWFR
jgi:hypothetical protein